MTGIVAVLNNTQLDQMKAAQSGALQAPVDPFGGLVGRLSGHLETCWQAAKQAKDKVEQGMLEDLRQREGFYSPEKLAAIKAQGGSEIYMLLTGFKCRAAEGWFTDVLFPAGERPFVVKPSPVPDLPPEVMQQLADNVAAEAQEAIASGFYPTPQQVFDRAKHVAEQVKARLRDYAKRQASMQEDAIDDVFVEGGWYEAMEGFISDFVTFPAAILKGPVVRKKRKMKWGSDPRTGRPVPMPTDELTPEFYSPSPFDIYPAPDSRAPGDGYLFERISCRPSQLYAMIGVPGYNEMQIRAALAEYRHGFSLSIPVEQQRRELEKAEHYQNTPADNTLDILEFNGQLPGWMLLEWGMDAARVPDPQASYDARAWKLGRFIVRAVLNEDPLGRSQYMTASFDKVKGQFWGRGLPRILRDLQDLCNATARALVNNMALSSGPLVEVESDRVADGEDITSLHPWRIMQTKASKLTPAPAVRFHDVPSKAAELTGVFEFFSRLADTYSGINAFDTGVNQTKGAAGTASGLSMLMSASSRTIRRAVCSVDSVTSGSCERTHTWLMLHRPSDGCYGDAILEARGASSLMVKEQMAIRRGEFLAMTANPIDMQIIGPEGRAELLREAVKSFDFDPEMIVPNREEVVARVRATMMQQLAMQSAAGGPPAPGGGAPAGRPAPGAGPGPGLPPPRTLDPGGAPAGGTDSSLF